MPRGIYPHKKGHKRPPITEEWRKNMSKARLGKTPWNKGVKTGPNSIISKLKKGKPSFFKGKKHSKESREKMACAANGIHLREKNGNWKGGVTLLNWQIRNSTRYSQWRSDVFERDGYCCKGCGKTKCRIEAHHIKMFSSIIADNSISSMEEALICEELWSMSNGVTLCKECHKIENVKQKIGNKYARKNTNVKANIKSYNTNVIANVKSINTNS